MSSAHHHVQSLAAREYLDMVSRLLQRARVADPVAGLWEAADFQWWWRRKRASDGIDQVFWLDANGEPVAAAVLTDWGVFWGCDVIAPVALGANPRVVWDQALSRIDAVVPSGRVEVRVRDDDETARALLVSAGFSDAGETGHTTWLDAESRPEVVAMPDGYRLRARSDLRSDAHHMVARNGDAVAERLLECSLYDPEMDLFVEAFDGDLAAYALFWPDAETGVGLIEPVRTETAHMRIGLGRALLSAGLAGLAARGCARFKVSFEDDNEAARRLYLGLGFVPAVGDRVYRRSQS